MQNDIDLKRFMDILQEEFEKLISEKTSWGRVELRLLMEQAKVAAIIRIM